MSHCFTMVCPGPRILVYTIIMVTMGAHTLANKYSEAANTKVHFERNPFRMAKLNLLWDKALKRLSEPKLKSLLSELKVQDKEEMTLKKLKTDGADKEGLKEAELRKKLRGWLRTSFADVYALFINCHILPGVYLERVPGVNAPYMRLDVYQFF
nr:alpha-2-macroglobulin receptor-associated protein-like [Cherax quadricarinatus]